MQRGKDYGPGWPVESGETRFASPIRSSFLIPTRLHPSLTPSSYIGLLAYTTLLWLCALLSLALAMESGVCAHSLCM